MEWTRVNICWERLSELFKQAQQGAEKKDILAVSQALNVIEAHIEQAVRDSYKRTEDRDTSAQ